MFHRFSSSLYLPLPESTNQSIKIKIETKFKSTNQDTYIEKSSSIRNFENSRNFSIKEYFIYPYLTQLVNQSKLRSKSSSSKPIKIHTYIEKSN